MFHSKEKGKIPWNPNMSGEKRVKVFFAGVIVILVCAILFIWWFPRASTPMEYIFLGGYTVYMALGFLFVISTFDWRSSKAKHILCGFIIGVIVILCISPARRWLIVFIPSIATCMIMWRFENIVVTVVTFFGLFLIVGNILNWTFTYFSKNIALVTYLVLVVYILFYMCVGFWINCKVIEKFFDPSTKEAYTEKHFKNLMSLFYTVTFIVLNITTYSHGLHPELFNLLNNACLTSLAVIQLPWIDILMIDKSKDMRIIKKGKELKSFLLKDGEK